MLNNVAQLIRVIWGLFVWSRELLHFLELHGCSLLALDGQFVGYRLQNDTAKDPLLLLDSSVVVVVLSVLDIRYRGIASFSNTCTLTACQGHGCRRTGLRGFNPA